MAPKNILTIPLSVTLITLLSALIAMLYLNQETLAHSLNQISASVNTNIPLNMNAGQLTHPANQNSSPIK